MNYRRALVTRWSRRDWLAVLIVALIAALLVGTTLLVVTAGNQTQTLADDFEANATIAHYDSPEEARAAADPESIVLPTATATQGGGESKRVVGVPDTSREDVGLSPPPAEAVGPVSTPQELRVNGTTTNVTVIVSPDTEASIVPSSWIRVNTDIIETVGATGAFVIEPTDEDADEGTPLVGVLAFFVEGTNEVVGIIWGAVAVAGLVVGLTVSNVVRMVISDRTRTIRVARATGAPPRRINLLFAARAGLLAGVGVAFGYAIGVIVTNTAVNIAVFLGFPTTLSLQVTASVALLLCGILGVLTVIGALSGYLTARAATTVPVARVGNHSPATGSFRSIRIPRLVRNACQPTILRPRTIVPTTATLSAFAIVVLLIAALGGVGGSLATDGTTLTQPDASHPINSNLPEQYAAAIDGPDVAASPEILLFGSHDGQPYLARGGEYESFAAVTGAELATGRAPSAPDEAVIGTTAADTLGLTPGDVLTMGGSTEAAVARVTIVGTYETGGIDDHQMLVSLETARHLSGVPDGSVNVIRTDTSVSGPQTDTTAVVLGVDAPRYVGPDEALPVEVSLWNPTDDREQRALTVELDDTSVERTVWLSPRERTTVQFELTDLQEGDNELTVDSIRQPVTVTDTPPVDIALPEAVPPEETIQIWVEDVSGDAVTNGTVAVVEPSTQTDADETTGVSEDGATQIEEDGTAWIRTPENVGTYELVVRSDERETRESLQVTGDVSRQPLVETGISPAEPTVHVHPTATAQLWNPWNRTIETSLGVEGPGTNSVEQVRLSPGETTEVSTTLERRPPGEYTVSVTADGQLLTTDTYQVGGDERFGAALASSGHYGGGGGLGNAIEYAIGNLSVFLAALVFLTAVTIVGTMGAVLARAVRARRHLFGVYRATGASPGRLVRLVVLDAVRIGAVSAVLALGVAIVVTSLLASLGQLTAFGIALDPLPSPTVAGGVLAGSILLTLVAAVIVTIPVVRTPVRKLLTPSGQPPSAISGTEPTRTGTSYPSEQQDTPGESDTTGPARGPGDQSATNG